MPSSMYLHESARPFQSVNKLIHPNYYLFLMSVLVTIPGRDCISFYTHASKKARIYFFFSLYMGK